MIDPKDPRLFPMTDGKVLTGVTEYTFHMAAGGRPTLSVTLLADQWVPPLNEAEVKFDLSQWPPRARGALRIALDEADDAEEARDAVRVE